MAGLWAFPSVWYTKTGAEKFVWFTARTNVADWAFKLTPIDKAQEAALTADETFAGEFSRRGEMVQVFSASRFSDNPDEIGLFVHTPDRCWLESGWKLKSASPDLVEVDLHGVKLGLERRVFRWKNGEELLVYFAGMSAGQALPYRLDHNLSVGRIQQARSESKALGARARATDRKLWGRIWETFLEGRQVTGPKQFFRIATRTRGANDTAAEERLKTALAEWLRPGDYSAEAAAFAAAKAKGKPPAAAHD